MDASLDSLDSLASGYLQSAHFMRERIQLLTQYFSRSPVETPQGVTILGRGPRAGCRRKTFQAVALYFERYNAGHISFAHMLGGGRVQNSSWMWDKFVDEWYHRASSPWISSGQLSEFSEFSAALWWGSRLSLANSQGGAGDAKAPPTQNKPVGDHVACLPAFLLTPSPITLFTIEFFWLFHPYTSLRKLGRVHSVTCRLLLLAMPVIPPKADTWGRLFHL